MSSDIVLGGATRANLLALQNINTSIGTSEGHLATGLKVSSAVDNAVAFFQSQSLTNRAADLTLRKNNIDQGISSLTTATQAAQSVVTTLQQLQGILNTAKTDTATQRKADATQFNNLAKQLNNLVGDASYQGLNLVNSTASVLTLQFSIATSSTLKIAGYNLTYSKILSANQGVASKAASTLVGAQFSTVSNKTSKFDAAFNVLQSAVFQVQADAQALGGNVTFLQNRLSFTNNYITTLQSGSDKLVLADVNKESTNLVTLQTRQQLSIQSLSIATQSEQAVLRLFH